MYWFTLVCAVVTRYRHIYGEQRCISQFRSLERDEALKSQVPWGGHTHWEADGIFIGFHSPERVSPAPSETVKAPKALESGARSNEGSACLKENLRGCVHHGDRQPWTLGLGGSLGLHFFGLKEGGQQPDFLSISVYTE